MPSDHLSLMALEVGEVDPALVTMDQAEARWDLLAVLICLGTHSVELTVISTHPCVLFR